jgi:hypothetical protein
MQNSKITSISDFKIDLSRIKAIKINTNTTLGPTNVLKIDLNLRYEYVFNPNKKEYEKETISDTVTIEYFNYNQAQEALESLSEEWQEYLNSEEK